MTSEGFAGSVPTDPTAGGPRGDGPGGDGPGGDGPRGERPDANRPDAVPAYRPPPPPTTGDPAVDEALRALAGAVPGRPDDELDAFDAAYRILQDRLADVEA